MSPRSAITLAVLFAAALASWYLARSYEQEPGEVTQTPVHHGYYIKSARILGTDADGSLLYEIDAVRAEQQPDNRIQFTDVRISYTPDSDVPWTITSDSATLHPDSETVLLEGHVLATSTGDADGDETEIRTSRLQLDPGNFVAETDERVQVRIGARSITGTGMLASLQNDSIELKSNVSGRFIP